jgi:predicted dehydrogenase
MIKVGVLSTAHLHVDSYVAQLRSLSDEAELVGVWDDDAARRTSKAAEYGVPEFDDADALLEQADAVIVCSENAKHRPLWSGRRGRASTCCAKSRSRQRRMTRGRWWTPVMRRACN